MSGTPRVRQAGPDDAEEITKVHVLGWQWAYAQIMPARYLAGRQVTAERVERHRRELANQSDPARCPRATFVATRHAATVVGFINVGPYRNNQDAGNLADGMGEVYALYVTQDAAGKGVGRALLDAGVSWLHEGGMDPIRLWVLDANTRARAFYERCGFRFDGGRSTFVIEQPGERPVELDEVRYSRSGY